MEIIVFGSGAWGTALALLLHARGHRVTLWNRDPARAAAMAETRENPRLAGAVLPPGLAVTAEAAAGAEAELAVFAVPSYAMRAAAEAVGPFLKPGCLCVSVSKGLEAGSLLRMTQVLGGVLGEGYPTAALSGPSHAEEVALGMPTGVVAAAEERETALRVQDAFMGPAFRVYTNPDVAGVELCGALKNVVAIGSGVADGLGFGDNARALLITRAMNEAAALCLKAGGQSATCSGLAGTGDLIVTCSSRHSRNRRAGLLLGQGLGVEETLRQVGAVVEGYYAAAAMRSLSEKLGVEMPICHGIYEVLYEGLRPEAAIRRLMERDRREEFS
ncbi:MAG: NAD(P)-dependent glycerol-3-phosphate dehydrogenase [Oscillospiraceae bacterium]|nr:NAD(P)-dependent glycerol-3-phosphate dehydrogenase [Oscillospiraceae bacterium]